MKAITEEILRYELRNSQPEVYIIPEGKILTPAAREYLQQRKIRFEKEGGSNYKHQSKPKYIDYETGAFYYEKPEHMTQLFGNKLVCKDHPRILFRGKLDSLQATVVLNQAMIRAAGGSELLIQDLGEILKDLREMMRCDVLDEEMKTETIIGLTHAELRAHSHNPMKYYNIKQMILPDYTMGTEYAMLNQMRTAVRETEVAACTAFHVEKKYVRSDIIEELNRLSSAFHIMMCKHLAGEYQTN